MSRMLENGCCKQFVIFLKKSYYGRHDFWEQMTSFRTSIRVGETKTQLELSMPSVLLSWQVLTNSTAIASRSLSAGFGCMSNLKGNVQCSSQASTTNSTIPPAPTIIVSEPVVHSPTLETTEERSRKELKLDRKDAECEFSRYEDAGILHETAERNTDIVCFWEVCDIFLLVIHKLNRYHARKKNIHSRLRRYGCSACSSFICTFRAHIFIQQRDLHSTAQQPISDHTRGATSSEVHLQARPPQFYGGPGS